MGNPCLNSTKALEQSHCGIFFADFEQFFARSTLKTFSVISA